MCVCVCVLDWTRRSLISFYEGFRVFLMISCASCGFALKGGVMLGHFCGFV